MFGKNKDKNDPEVKLPSKESIERHLESFECIQKRQQERRMKAIEEEPRLEEYENYLTQYINDYIVTIQPHTIKLPTATYVYCCYSYIKNIITKKDYLGDKDFQTWFIRKDVGYIRQIISRELCLYFELCKH